MYEIISASQAQSLNEVYRSQVIEMTPREAVQITDSFRFSDFELGSVLGRYDGKVYETLWKEVQREPINGEIGLREEVLRMLKGSWKSESKL
jgi:acyl-CoA oxidase